MSSSLATGAVLAFLATGLWNTLPSWRWTEPDPAVAGGVQVSGPVTDSILTTFDCNCHCQDNTVVVGLFAFLCGVSAAFTLVCLCQRFFRTTEQSYEAPYSAPVARRPLQQPALAIENGPRRAVVTPSSRR